MPINKILSGMTFRVSGPPQNAVPLSSLNALLLISIREGDSGALKLHNRWQFPVSSRVENESYLKKWEIPWLSLECAHLAEEASVPVLLQGCCFISIVEGLSPRLSFECPSDWKLLLVQGATVFSALSLEDETDRHDLSALRGTLNSLLFADL